MDSLCLSLFVTSFWLPICCRISVSIFERTNGVRRAPFLCPHPHCKIRDLQPNKEMINLNAHSFPFFMIGCRVRRLLAHEMDAPRSQSFLQQRWSWALNNTARNDALSMKGMVKWYSDTMTYQNILYWGNRRVLKWWRLVGGGRGWKSVMGHFILRWLGLRAISVCSFFNRKEQSCADLFLNKHVHLLC